MTTSRSETTTNSKYNFILQAIHKIIAGIPIPDAVISAAAMGISLADGDNNRNLPLVVFASVIAFLVSIGLNNEAASKSSKEILNILAHQSLPSEWEDSPEKQEMLQEWPKLSLKLEALAAALMAAPAVVSAGLDSMKGFFFLKALPKSYPNKIPSSIWKIGGSIIGGCSGGATLIIKGTDTYRIIRKLFAGVKKPFSSSASYILTPIIAGLLSSLDAIQNGISAYVTGKNVLDIQAFHWRLLLAALSLLYCVVHFCNSGVVDIKAMDEFFDYVTNQKIELKDIAIFILALSLSIFLAYYTRPLNVDFYIQLFSEVKFFYSSLANALSWVMVAQTSLNGTSSLCHPTAKLFEYLKDNLSVITAKLKHYFTNDQNDQNENQPLLPHNRRALIPVVSITAPTPSIVDPEEYRNHLESNPSLLFNKKFKQGLSNSAPIPQKSFKLI